MEAALSAGMQMVTVPDGNLSQVLTRKVSLLLSSLQGFQPPLFGHHKAEGVLVLRLSLLAPAITAKMKVTTTPKLQPTQCFFL